MNNVTLIGRLTADPEIKTTQSGISLTHFSIAVDRQYSKDKEKETDFLDCTAWRGTAEFICKYFSKGMRIGLTGRIQTSTFTDRDGNKRKKWEILVNDCEFVERKQDSYVQSIEKSEPEQEYIEVPDSDDLPF